MRGVERDMSLGGMRGVVGSCPGVGGGGICSSCSGGMLTNFLQIGRIMGFARRHSVRTPEIGKLQEEKSRISKMLLAKIEN